MLEALRRGTAGIFAKVLLMLLIVAFGIWGVADVFRSRGADTVATVGDHTITTGEFQRAYQQQLDQIRRRFGSRITSEQARMFGLDNQVLSQLVGSSVIEQHARDLGLTLSEAAVAEEIRRDPAFRGPDGKFSTTTLQSILREAGYTEQSYLAARRRDEIREQITEALGAATLPPAALVEMMQAYRSEMRTVSLFVVDPAKVTVGQPDETKLTETFEANKTRFVVPEYRKVAVLLLTVDRLAQSLEIPEDQVRAAYEQGKELFSVPERRRIEQIAFPDKAAAEAALKKIRAGQKFTDAAKAAGAKDTDIDLGLLTREQVIDPKIAEAAFALAKDAVSDVVEGRFATVLVRVTAIDAGRQKPFDEVKGEIKDRLAQDKAADEIQKLHDQIDDQRAGGKSLPDIAASLKLTLVEVPAMDRSGLTPDGKPALVDADGRAVATQAFEAAPLTDSDAVEIGDQGYSWVRVLAVTPERQKALDEVKTEVAALWTEQERRRLVSDLAQKLAERASTGGAMDGLAKEAGGKVETIKDMKRTGGQPQLSDGAIAQAFATPKGRAVTADSKDGLSRAVIRIEDINRPAAPDKAESERLAQDLERQMQNDVLTAYIAALQDKFGVSINQAGLRQATGGAAAE